MSFYGKIQSILGTEIVSNGEVFEKETYTQTQEETVSGVHYDEGAT